MSDSTTTALGLAFPTTYTYTTSDFVIVTTGTRTALLATQTAPGATTTIPTSSIFDSLQANSSAQAASITSFVVCGSNATDGPCPTTTLQTAVATIWIVDSINPTSKLSSTTIVGIVFAVLAFLITVGTAVWACRRKAASQPQRVLPYVHDREGKPGDRSSIMSGRSAGSMRSTRSARSMLSLWSTFSNRQQNLNVERNHSLEDGVRVEVDTVQVVEEPYSPMTVPPTGVSLFTPRRTTREWTGYGVSGNRRANGTDETFNPSTIISSSSIPEEETEVEYPTHLIAKPGLLDSSPFSNTYDVKASPVDTQNTSSSTEPSEHDASQLSQRDLEALADIVAARLNRRVDISPVSDYPRVVAAPNAMDLPPRYY